MEMIQTGTQEQRKQIRDFRQAVTLARAAFTKQLQDGLLSEDLLRRIDALQAREYQLLNAALPLARSRVLQTRDPGARLEPLVPKAAALREASLTPAERALCEQLLRLDPPGEPILPAPVQGTGGAAASPADRSPQPAPYLSVRNAQTCFLFREDGSVLLLENNDGWECRRQPILQGCFAENALLESDSSCLLLNLDHGIDRLSYQRIAAAVDLSRLPLCSLLSDDETSGAGAGEAGTR